MAFQQARPYDTGPYFDPLATMAGIEQLRRGQHQNRLGELQMQMEQQKFQRANAAYEAQQKLLGSIQDPRERLAATMAPEKFAGHVFRDPKDNFAATESGVWDYSTGTPRFTPTPGLGGYTTFDGRPVGGGPGANLLQANPNPAPPPQAPGPRRTISTGPRQTAGGLAAVPEIYRPYVQDAADAYGVDPEVLGNMLLTETAPGGPLTSKAGARGVMQFMGPTAKQYGVDVNDPASSIDGAGRMMQYLLKKYGGDYRLAVGAYNWGEGNVDTWLAQGGDPSQVPRETLDYVGRTVGLNTPGPNDNVGQPTPVAAQRNQPGSRDTTDRAEGPWRGSAGSVLIPIKDRKGVLNNDFGYNPQTGQLERYPTRATTEVNIGDRTGSKEIVEGRAKRYEAIAQQGQVAQELKGKLQLLKQRLRDVGVQGPGADSFYAIMGTLESLGVPRENLNLMLQRLAGIDMGDPAAASNAQKLTHDFVSQALKGLGANPTDMDAEMVMKTVPGINNLAAANDWLIDNVLMPGLDAKVSLWEQAIPLANDPANPTMAGLDQLVFQHGGKAKPLPPRTTQDRPPAYDTGTARSLDTVPNPTQEPPQAPAATQAAAPQGDPPPAGQIPPEQGALWSNKVGGWVKPDPARPGKWLAMTPTPTP